MWPWVTLWLARQEAAKSLLQVVAEQRIVDASWLEDAEDDLPRGLRDGEDVPKRSEYDSAQDARGAALAFARDADLDVGRKQLTQTYLDAQLGT